MATRTWKSTTALVRQISAAIGDNQIDVAIFDPLVTLHSVSEATAERWTPWFGCSRASPTSTMQRSRLITTCASPPPASCPTTTCTISAEWCRITDAVRAARVLNRMNKGDAEAAGRGECRRCPASASTAPRATTARPEAATWRQFVTSTSINGDEVGVVAPWNFPGQGEQTAAEGRRDQQAERYVPATARQVRGARRQRERQHRAEPFAPARFAEEPEAKVAKVSKAALKAAMNRLLDAGRIRSDPMAAATATRTGWCRETRNDRRCNRRAGPCSLRGCGRQMALSHRCPTAVPPVASPHPPYPLGGGDMSQPEVVGTRRRGRQCAPPPSTCKMGPGCIGSLRDRHPGLGQRRLDLPAPPSELLDVRQPGAAAVRALVVSRRAHPDRRRRCHWTRHGLMTDMLRADAIRQGLQAAATLRPVQ